MFLFNRFFKEWDYVRVGFCPGGILSWWDFVRWDCVLVGFCPVEFCPFTTVGSYKTFNHSCI